MIDDFEKKIHAYVCINIKLLNFVISKGYPLIKVRKGVTKENSSISRISSKTVTLIMFGLQNLFPFHKHSGLLFETGLFK